MNRALEQMVRVSKATPCPVCEKPDWCLVARDRSAAICQRVKSDRECGQAGYLHRLTTTGPVRRGMQTRRIVVTIGAGSNFEPLADRCHREGWHQLQHLSAD